MTDTEKTAVILLGHGSRVPGSGEGMERVARGLLESTNFNIVEICYMSLMGPTFDEALKTCVEKGARRVIVIPYFLHLGVHMLEDIPQMMRESAANHPDTVVIFGKHLGYDHALVDLVAKRVLESENLCDVRSL